VGFRRASSAHFRRRVACSANSFDRTCGAGADQFPMKHVVRKDLSGQVISEELQPGEGNVTDFGVQQLSKKRFKETFPKKRCIKKVVLTSVSECLE